MSSVQEQQGVMSEDQLGDFFDFAGATELEADVSGDGPDVISNEYTLLSNSSELAIQSEAPLVTEQPNGPEPSAEDYARLQDWIPRFVRPDEPCGYCRSKRLNCYLSYGKLTCTACDTLFRPCSFAKVDDYDHGSSHEPANEGLLDTLHSVTEDVTQQQGATTSTRMLKSKSTIDDKKSNPRFSRVAVKILKDWVATHNDKPYPSEEEKVELQRLTGLRYGQINTWLANARRRGKVGRGRSKGAMSPGLRHASPVGIPSSNIEVLNWENMNPLERWKHSPPTNEPAPIHAIKDALFKNELPPLESASSSTLGYTGFASSREESGTHSKSVSVRRAPSMTSVEQVISESGASSAAWSGSFESFGSFGSFGSSLHGKKDRRRRRRGAAPLMKNKADENSRRIFQCTFCCDTFKSKYDWTRHEKSLHLSLEKFICCPLGPRIPDSATGEELCAYCLSPHATTEHLDLHGHQICEEKGREARTFHRKDHLRQHLKLVHGSQLLPHMETWKVEAKFINSRCGFCKQRFTVWQDRVDHIAAHFKEGKRMIDWKGCRGLDPIIAANVLNAMPPYLIGTEQMSLEPFSATGPKRSPFSVTAGNDNKRPPATSWEILTVRLGRFAKEQAEKGVLLTDEMLQNQARLILYDDSDPWNQTAADNPEWLDLFKRAHGLDYLPSAVGGEGTNVPDDLEVYGDLGVRVPFSVQLSHGVTDDIPPFYQEALLRAKAQTHQGQSTEPTESRCSALPIPYSKAKHFETVPAPYPEAGVRGTVIYTKDMSDADTYNRCSALDHLGMDGVSLLDDSGTTSRTDSTEPVTNSEGQSLDPYTTPSYCDPGLLTPDCMLSILGVDIGARDGPNMDNTLVPVFTEQRQQPQQHQTDFRAQERLDALNASLAAATTAPQPANAAACCSGTSPCKHSEQFFSQFCFHNNNDHNHNNNIDIDIEHSGMTMEDFDIDSAVATAAPSVTATGLQHDDIAVDDFDFEDVALSFPEAVDQVGEDVEFTLF